MNGKTEDTTSRTAAIVAALTEAKNAVRELVENRRAMREAGQ